MWLFESKEVKSGDIDPVYTGFVYVITNLTNNKKYIGKKSLTHTKYKQVNKKRKRIKVESDWETYYGSNKTLQAEVVRLGSENFKREILRFCKSTGECSYYELREQIDRRALESDEYYNDYIHVRVSRSHLSSKKTSSKRLPS